MPSNSETHTVKFNNIYIYMQENCSMFTRDLNMVTTASCRFSHLMSRISLKTVVKLDHKTRIDKSVNYKKI